MPSGQKVESSQDYADYIVNLLKKEPLRVSDIAGKLSKSTKQTQRYLALCGNKITKIENSHYWKLSESHTNKKKLTQYKNTKTLGEVYNTTAFKRFEKTYSKKRKEGLKKSLVLLCIGKRIKGVSFHPDNFTFPDTAELIRDGFREQNGTDKLKSSQKRILRQFIDYCTDYSLDNLSRDLRDIGIDGDKEKPKQSRLHMKERQYKLAKQILKKKSTEYYLKFGFGYGTFCRPSSKYIVELSQLTFYDRTISYIEINGEKFTDRKLILAMQDKHKVFVKTHRAVAINEFVENKTGDNFLKYIWDEEIAIALEKYVAERKQNGFRYLFWDNNSTEFNKNNYTKLTETNTGNGTKLYQELFLECGFERTDFSKNFRAGYAVRHFGVQHMLQATGYNYGLIANMEWDDINTLIIWYGQRTSEYFQKELSEITWSVV